MGTLYIKSLCSNVQVIFGIHDICTHSSGSCENFSCFSFLECLKINRVKATQMQNYVLAVRFLLPFQVWDYPQILIFIKAVQKQPLSMSDYEIKLTLVCLN